jgi:hypothetical protein
MNRQNMILHISVQMHKTKVFVTFTSDAGGLLSVSSKPACMAPPAYFDCNTSDGRATPVAKGGDLTAPMCCYLVLLVHMESVVYVTMCIEGCSRSRHFFLSVKCKMPDPLSTGVEGHPGFEISQVRTPYLSKDDIEQAGICMYAYLQPLIVCNCF